MNRMGRWFRDRTPALLAAVLLLQAAGASAATVTVVREGEGIVKSAVRGIACGETCSADFPATASVKLVATPLPGSLFRGWGGACDGIPAGVRTCVVTAEEAKEVTATFMPFPTSTLSVTTSGEGTVRGAGLACGEECTADFTVKNLLRPPKATLTAKPGPTYFFEGWSGGGCSGTGKCTVTLAESAEVAASFVPIPRKTLTVVTDGSGTGTVKASPGGLDLGLVCADGSCTGTYLLKNPLRPVLVTLKAKPAEGSTFAGWGGACQNLTGPCKVYMGEDRTVTASFTSTTQPANTPPVAAAGPDQTVDAGATVTLNGSGSDADANPLTYSWAFTEKPAESAAALSDATVATPTFVADKAGTYTLSLTVSDGKASSTDSVTITANALNPPPEVNVSAVPLAAGYVHNIAIKADGTLWGWGYNGSGELARTSCDWCSESSPVQAAANFTGVKAVAAGKYHTLFLKDDGTVWASGKNDVGQLGNGATTDSDTPVQATTAAGPLSGIVAVAAGHDHSLALKSDGTVWAWGGNSGKKLGDGTMTDRNTAVQVLQGDGYLTGVTAISAGQDFSMALKGDGTVWAWGKGKLGNGTNEWTGRTAVQVSNLAGVTAIGSGTAHMLAVKGDGTVWGWNDNYNGELGDGTTTSALVPVQMSGMSGAVAVDGAQFHTVVLKSDGTVWTCGMNGSGGYLGNGTAVQNSTVPVQVSNLTGVSSIAAHGNHSLARKSDGTLWSWGENSWGELGDGTNNSRNVPVQISGF